jgi:hypothetical protein
MEGFWRGWRGSNPLILIERFFKEERGEVGY